MAISDEWAKQQFEEARIKIAVGKTVLKLLEVWRTVNLTKEDEIKTLEVFSKLARGFALVEENKDEVWVKAMAGQVKVGDEVRVAFDAFSHEELGVIHNGRRGMITAIRSGDIIVKSTDDRLPALDGAHFSANRLEKRIK